MYTRAESGSDSIRKFGSGGEIEDLSSFDGSDSSTEMASIDESIRRRTCEPLKVTPTEKLQFEITEKEAEPMGMSSQDVTMSEVRDRLSGQQSEGKGRTEKLTKSRKAPGRGVPMREEFFGKIGLTRSFISGPADPLHNPHIV